MNLPHIQKSLYGRICVTNETPKPTAAELHRATQFALTRGNTSCYEQWSYYELKLEKLAPPTGYIDLYWHRYGLDDFPVS